MYKNISTVSYPVEERNGIVFGLMGPGDPPPLPGHSTALPAPRSHVFAFKGLWEKCNWLQAMELASIRPMASFLHRFPPRTGIRTKVTASSSVDKAANT